MSKAKKAYLFDLDGTLVDSAPDLTSATNHVLRAHDRSETSVNQVRGWVGQGAKKILKEAFSELHQPIPDDALPALIDYYEAHIADNSVIYPGVREALSVFYERGNPMAVVTNKYRYLAIPLLEKLGLMVFFGAIIGGTCAEKPKPYSHPIVLACEQLGVRPEQAVMVGDSYNDQAAAAAAGADYYQVTYGYGDGRQSPVRPKLIDSFLELV